MNLVEDLLIGLSLVLSLTAWIEVDRAQYWMLLVNILAAALMANLGWGDRTIVWTAVGLGLIGSIIPLIVVIASFYPTYKAAGKSH